MDVQLPDGTTLKGIPDGTTKSQIAEKLKASGHAVPDDWLKPQSLKRPGEGYTLAEHADIAASVVSSAGASVLGGLAKAGAYANKALGLDTVLGTAGQDPAHAGDWLEEHLTYSPRTKAGKAVIGDVQKGMKAFEDWSEKQGQGATDAILAAKERGAEMAKALGAPQSVVDFIETHGRELAAGYGAATKTALNAAPLLVGEFTKGLKGAPRVGEVAEAPKAAPPTAAAPPAEHLTLAPSVPRAAPGAPPAAVAAPAAPLEAAPAAPRGTPNVSLEGPAPAAAAPTTPKARAQAYARDRLGVAWDDLAARTREKLERIAGDAQALDRLNPEAVKRQAKLEALRVPIQTTAGKLNRDNPQLLKEQGAAATDAGKPIRDIDIKANRDLRANVEVLIDRLRGVGRSRATATDKEGVGAAVAGKDPEAPGALTKKQQLGQKAVNAAYDTARKTEPNAKVSPEPMYEFVRGNPEVLNPQIQHLSWLQGWLKKAGIESEGVDAAGNVTTERRPIRLSELDDLRKKAVALAKAGGTDGHYAGEVLKAIDKTFEEVPDAAKAWKNARKLHSEQQAEFTNQEAIQRLVGTKGGAYGKDPKTALEDVWKVSVKNAKLEQIRQLKRSLLGGADAETRLAGKKALRELRAETARDLLRDITKGVSTNEAGEANITAESINRWMNGMGGREKLEVILGRKATRELEQIREAAQIVKTEPTVRNVGSNTFQKILNWMDDWIPVDALKSLAGGGVKLAEKVYKTGENARIARSAQESATSAAEGPARRAAMMRLEAQQREAEALRRRRGAPPTYGQQE